MPKRLFTPSPHHVASTPRIDTGADVRDVLAIVSLQTAHAATELVIGLDLGRVIRVVGTRELPARARRQLEYHERARSRLVIHADELFVLDVQAIEVRPDTPGADDPLYLHGVLRGPYPQGLTEGVVGIEGQLATTRGPLLDGLGFGLTRAFLYEAGRSGKTCTHAALPIGRQRSLVLAFPLVPMGEDGSNEVVAAQLIHGVLGALRADLGDDLVGDPVPVSNRRQHERDLIAAGWRIEGERAIRRRGRNRLVSLFLPVSKQKLPREIPLADYEPLIAAQLDRVPGWSASERRALRRRLGLLAPERDRTPKSPPAKADTQRRSKRKQERKKQNRDNIQAANQLRKQTRSSRGK